MTSTIAQSTAAPAALPTFEAAAELEQILGCPFDPGNGMSLARGVRADDLEAEPTAAYEAAWSAGLHEHLVPVSEGGRLASFESMLATVRVASRRELAVSVGLGSTLLATAPVWIWGDDAQRRRVAELVLGRAWGTAGISEEDAGSDLLATATRATPCSPRPSRLSGCSWSTSTPSVARGSSGCRRCVPMACAATT
jgi:alkylation response protein AidB-like acyl-CoA dehydrogenase